MYVCAILNSCYASTETVSNRPFVQHNFCARVMLHHSDLDRFSLHCAGLCEQEINLKCKTITRSEVWNLLQFRNISIHTKPEFFVLT